MKEYGITANFDTVPYQTDKFTYNFFMNNTMLLLSWMVSQFTSEYFLFVCWDQGFSYQRFPSAAQMKKCLGVQ